MILPPLTLSCRAMAAACFHTTLVDVSSKLKWRAAPLGATRPTGLRHAGDCRSHLSVRPKSIHMQCQAGERCTTLFRDPAAHQPASARVALADQNVTADTAIDRQEIRRNGGLSESITGSARSPPRVHPAQGFPRSVVRFETALNGKVAPEFTRDLRLSGIDLAAGVGSAPVNPLVLQIETKKMVSPTRPTRKCASAAGFTGPSADMTEEIYNASIYVLSVDPRPDSVKPYVHGRTTRSTSTTTGVWSPRGRSKIHKVPGQGRLPVQHPVPFGEHVSAGEVHQFAAFYRAAIRHDRH